MRKKSVRFRSALSLFSCCRSLSIHPSALLLALQFGDGSQFNWEMFHHLVIAFSMCLKQFSTQTELNQWICMRTAHGHRKAWEYFKMHSWRAYVRVFGFENPFQLWRRAGKFGMGNDVYGHIAFIEIEIRLTHCVFVYDRTKTNKLSDWATKQQVTEWPERIQICVVRRLSSTWWWIWIRIS